MVDYYKPGYIIVCIAWSQKINADLAKLYKIWLSMYLAVIMCLAQLYENIKVTVALVQAAVT